MGFLSSKCAFYSAEETPPEEWFDCDHSDLNDFFNNDCLNYSTQLFGKTYYFSLNENAKEIVCAFTIANDSIKGNLISKKKRNKLNRKIPNQKRILSYPAVLIGRLGVNKKHKKQKIGTELMDFIKTWFIDPKNKTGCRYVVVDSYNNDIPIAYYKHTGFDFLFDSEEEEIQLLEKPKEPLKTRLMYFDLITLR